ncbi:hypothetical protein C8J57DRAFT_1255163 [Mycena rebaudengoi]|nr:hypothetical protein C8J57DRAFT_1255163 [Mycena rebaudengoi]
MCTGSQSHDNGALHLQIIALAQGMSSNPDVKCLFGPFKHCLNRPLNGPDYRTVRLNYHDERLQARVFAEELVQRARGGGGVHVERQVRQARERTQARPGGVVERREVVVQELQVRGACEEGVREAGRAGEEVDGVDAQAQGAHKGKVREARRVDREVARKALHGAADGEDLRDVGDWGLVAEVQHEMPCVRAKQLVCVHTVMLWTAIHENTIQEWLQPAEYQPKTT